MASSTVSNLYSHPTEKWMLRGDAAASYLRMRAAGMPKGGIQVFHRSLAKQKELYKRYKAGRGPVAAPPNPNAPHVKGVAMDAQTAAANGSYSPGGAHKWLVNGGTGSKPSPFNSAGRPTEKIRANSYGWSRTVRTERWHYGYDPAKDTKVAADLSRRLKILGFGSVKAFQKSRGLTEDGKAGPVTWAELLRVGDRTPPPAASRTVLKRGDKGADVAALAKQLARFSYDVGTPTDVFGERMELAVRDFQRQARIGVDGVAGKQTQATLLASGPFRFGQINLESARFGGLPDASKARGQYLRDKLVASVYALSEVPEPIRDAIIGVLGSHWKVYPVGYTAVLWDSSKWDHQGRADVVFDSKGVHGAVRATLVNRATRLPLDVIAVHVRPGDAFGVKATDEEKLAGKKADIRKALTLVRAGVPTVFAGDFNTSHAGQVAEAAGLVRATPAVDTVHDQTGDQKLDHVFVTPGVGRRGRTLVSGKGITDHHGWLVNLTQFPAVDTR